MENIEKLFKKVFKLQEFAITDSNRQCVDDALDYILSKLSDENRNILNMVFGLENGVSMTYEQCADEIKRGYDYVRERVIKSLASISNGKNRIILTNSLQGISYEDTLAGINERSMNVRKKKGRKIF